MKGSTFSSSGELSESQGLNDFLNAHNIRDEAKALNKNRPEPTFLQSMNPRHNDLTGYQQNMANYQGGMNPNAQFYGYEDEEFDEYGEEGNIEYEEERDPYDYEVDLGPPKKRNAAKVLDKSYEERKKALQKKKDAKKKAKEEEIKKKEEEEKRKKIDLAMQNEKHEKKPKISKPNLNLEEKNPQKFDKKNEKISFDIADALNESPSESQTSKSQEDYLDPKPIIYDPGEMAKYMGKSLLSQASQSQSQVANNQPIHTEEDESSNRNNLDENNNLSSKNEQDVYDANQTNQYLKKSLEFEESQKKSQEIKKEENIEKNMDVLNPKGGLEEFIKGKIINEKTEIKENNVLIIPEQKKIINEINSIKPSIQEINKQENSNNHSPEIQANSNKTAEIIQSFNKTTEVPLNFTKTPETTTNFNKTFEIPSNLPFKEATNKRELSQKSEELEAALKRNEAYQTEIEALVQQLEFSERKVAELELENRNLKFSSDSKLRFMHEKTNFLDKMNETRLTNQLNEQFILEKESMNLELEKLRSELVYSQAQNEQRLENLRENKVLNQRKQYLEEEVKGLKRLLLDYQDLIKDPIIQRRALRRDLNKKTKDEENSEDAEEDFQREFEFQELLIKGYQKENEKNVYEIRALKKEIEEMTEKVFEKENNIGNLKAKLAKEKNGFFIVENEPNIEFLKGVTNPEVLISGNEIKDLRGRLLGLQEEIKGLKEENFRLNREKEEKHREFLEEKNNFEEKIKGFEENVKRFEEKKKENEEKLKGFEGDRLKFDEKLKEIEEANKNVLKIQINNLKKQKASEANFMEIEPEKEENIQISQTKPKKTTDKSAKINEKLNIPSSFSKVSSKKPIGKNPLKPKAKDLDIKKNLIKTENNESANKIKPEKLEPELYKENKPLNLDFLAETNIKPSENSIPFSKFLGFLNSSILLSLSRVYSILKELETIKEEQNPENYKLLFEEIQNKTTEFHEDFKEFQEEIHEFLDNKTFGKIEVFSLRKKFEKGLYFLINSSNYEKNQRNISFGNPKRNNFMKNEGEFNEKWKKIEVENHSLRELLSNMPKNPTRVDFEIIEKKLEFIERNYRQKELEINMTLETIKNPMRFTPENQSLRLELLSARNQFDREKKEFEEVLRRKNKEIETFRQELEELLREIELLRN